MKKDRELYAEDNLMIAYFHGATYTGEYLGSKGGYSDTILMDYTKVDCPDMAKYISNTCMEYHCNWGWIIPVIMMIRKDYAINLIADYNTIEEIYKELVIFVKSKQK